MISPTQRSLALLRKEGYKAQVVEHFNMFAHVRQDLFGFIDILAIKPGLGGVLGVQTTSGAHMSDHRLKIAQNPLSEVWVQCGNHIELHGWSKKGKAGKRKLWEVNREEILDINHPIL